MSWRATENGNILALKHYFWKDTVSSMQRYGRIYFSLSIRYATAFLIYQNVDPIVMSHNAPRFWWALYYYIIWFMPPRSPTYTSNKHTNVLKILLIRIWLYPYQNINIDVHHIKYIPIIQVEEKLKYCNCKNIC